MSGQHERVVVNVVYNRFDHCRRMRDFLRLRIVKNQEVGTLTALICAANRAAYAHALVGQEVVVCVEKDGNGRTDDYLRCLLDGRAPRRSLVRAKVTEYFPKTGALSATICAGELKEEHTHDNA